ncbi:hypothetical protein [Sporosarcina sp. FSL W7-1283]|uniref:hypothetical protein n=1 Tax=Sporosarcina sp. FSL W7-1283 TaxID=2921560 RepID=UPI0030F63EB3
MTKRFLTNKTFNIYKTTVEGNESISRKQAELKMKRNMQLAHSSTRVNGGVHYKFGCLHFIVVKDRVVWMQNNLTPEKNWKKNNREYLRLNKELGIESNETLFSLNVKEIKCNLKYNINKLKWKIKLRLA